MSKSSFFSYFKFFLKDPRIASLTPSSKYLVARIVRAMDLKGPETVIEYGPAQGVLTRRILDALSPAGRLYAVERNTEFFSSLEKIADPRLKASLGDVRSIERLATENAFPPADAVVSGIPFAFLTASEREELAVKTSRLLKPGGRFVAYQITTHLIPLLKRHFARVETSFEPRNLPPHFVITAFK